MVQLAQLLEAEGLTLWLDENEMRGDIVTAMTDGIDRAAVVLVCVTKNYLIKAAGKGVRRGNDNCKAEFDYACLRGHGVGRMLAAVLEPEARDTARWSGAVGMKLGGKLYVDVSPDDFGGAETVRRLANEIQLLKSACREGRPGSTAPQRAATPTGQMDESQGKTSDDNIGLTPHLQRSDV